MARLHMDSLKYKTNLGDFREAVRRFPQDLDELYEDTWNRVTNQNPEWRTLACQTLGWLSSAFRQLKIEELLHALTVRSGDTVLDSERLPAVDVLCESCHGLVTIDEESRIVRLVHRTAQEFFDRHRAQYFSNIHTQIARTCLDYLMFDVFAQGPCDFISSRPSDMGAAQGDISERKFSSTRFLQNPLLDYAASHWGLHARGEPEQELEEPILRFLQPSAILNSFFQVQYSGLNYAGVQNTFGSLPLHVATSFGLEHIVNVLLGKLSDSDINGLDQKGKTALHWAVLNGSESLTLLLLQAGANIDTQVKAEYSDFDGQNSLGYNRIFKLFLSSGTREPIDKIVVLNEEVLENVVRFGMKKVIEMHINSAASVADKKVRANGVLWKASSLGRIDMIDVSLANGADIEAKEKIDVMTQLDVEIEDFRTMPVPRRAKDQTALLMAVENGRLGATLALLSRGALISATDRFGKDALQTAVTSTKVFDERLSLISNDTRGPWQSTPTGITENVPPSQLSRSEQDYRTKLSRVVALGLATEPFQEFEAALHEDNEQKDIINRLLDSGANMAVKTPHRQTLLHLAIGSATRLHLLLSRGASVLKVDARDQTGRTALHYAAAAGYHSALQVLVAHGADVTARDPMGATALHLGILSPHSVEFALQRGISAIATDDLGRTPMHYLMMLHKRSKQNHHLFRTVMRSMIMINGYAGEEVVALLEKASPGKLNLQDGTGLRPMDYIEASLGAQFEFTDTARWIGYNEERYRLRREVVYHHFNNIRISDDKLTQGRLDKMFSGKQRWRIIPDEVSASPNEPD